jgi:bifunctional DNA-binding transcriptional regulator/antitoxin component of YhaV-PrlF toxin-antitoxin module
MAHVTAPRDSASKTGRVWAIADDLTRAAGRKATRREVVEAYQAEGGHPGTGNVQYGYWSKEHDRASSGATSPVPTATERKAALTVGADGRVVIPAAMRRAMRLDDEGRVTALLDEDGVLTLISLDAAITKAQRYAMMLDRGEGSVVDELIAERRAEAALEDAED